MLPRDGGAQRRLNNWLAVVLVATLALAVVPLGSNRPAFWAIWALVVGLVALGYGLCLLVIRGQPRLRLRQLRPELLLYVATLAYLVVQILPLGRWLPLDVPLQDGSSLAPNTISLDPGSTWLTFVQFATFGMLFYLTGQAATNQRRARQMLFALLLVIAGFALYGVLALTQLGDTLLFFKKESYLGFATGTFVNRNSFATFLACGIVIGGSLLIDTILDRDKGRTLSARMIEVAAIVVSLVAISATLFATGSRMGTAAGATGLLVTGFLAFIRFRGSWRFGLGLLLAVTIVAVLIISLYGTQLIERLVFTTGLDEGRTEIHRQVWVAIWQRPWLGYGGGSFASTFPIFQQPGEMGAFIWDRAHSTYLALWYESGLIFGSMPLLIIVLLALRALLALRHQVNPVTSIAMIGVVVVFAVHSLLDFSAEIEANAMLFAAMLAIGAAAAVRPRSSGGARQ